MLNSLCTVSLQAILALLLLFILTAFIINGIILSCNIWRLFSVERCPNPSDARFPLTQAQMAVTSGLCYLSYSGWEEGREQWVWVWPGQRASPFPLGVCSNLSRLSPSEQRLHGQPPSREHLSHNATYPSLPANDSNWWVSCELWCPVKKCFSSVFNVFFL